ncbi:MAG: hypothetical protein ACRD82_21930 [Blastocatellia bacterium]
MIEDEGFKGRHRWSEKAFTRDRSLTFALVVVLVLRNSRKSLQNMVNEAMVWLERGTVTASAYWQARYKLKYTGFIQLNRKAVVETLYGDGEYRRFRGFRVLAIDGSKIVLPDTEDVRKAFGTIAWTGGEDAQLSGERPYAVASVLYEVLNRVALDAVLGRATAYEGQIGLSTAPVLHECRGPVGAMDRNYPSYRMLAELNRSGREFVIRFGFIVRQGWR